MVFTYAVGPHTHTHMPHAKAGSDPNKGSDDGRTALMAASVFGHDLCARALLEAGSDPNKAKDNGFTALMLASQNGHDQCARALLEAVLTYESSSINYRDDEHLW